jgi:protein-L-isoaspartate(D-aspartate) O-methyltransferase
MLIPSRRSGLGFLAIIALAAGGCTPQIADSDWTDLRRRMVDDQLKGRDIKDDKVLAAMGKVPRHEFVPEEWRTSAYQDRALPIGLKQTISQPYIVALMTQVAAPKAGDKVLEVGTGSGYQAAVLAEIGVKVYTIELLEELADQAKARLKRLGYDKIEVKAGDGYLGWPDAAPFDAILVTCGAESVPAPLFEQLKKGGRMVIPVGTVAEGQVLRVITKNAKGEREERDLIPVRFVPLRRAADVKDR